MLICPACRTPYDDPAIEICPQDRRRLVQTEDFWAADGDPMLGKTIAGRFTVLSRIGVGGMGTVYRAEQATVGRKVAIKILKSSLHEDADTVTRFHREAKATSLLQHPNTVTMFDFGQTKEGLLYLAMELLEGELLTSLIEREGALDLKRAVAIARQVLGSLSEAHDQGIIHRDLKPDNIFLTWLGSQSEHVKVLDFGIAKVFHSEMRMDALETQAGIVFGTPRYMSPEQAQSKPLDGRSDLYTVGVLLYQMITGHAPFEDDDAVVVMARHIKTRPPRPSALRPDLYIPEAVEKVILRAIEKDPARRPQTAGEFMVALESCTAEIALPREEQKRPASHRARRSPAPLLAAGLAALVGGGLAVLALRSRGTSEAAVERSAIARPAARPSPDRSAPPATQRARFARIRIDSIPPEAAVRRGGTLLGTTPIESMEPISPTPVAFELSLAGHRAVVREVVPDADSTIRVELEPMSTAGSAPSGQSRPVSSPRDGQGTKASGHYQRFDQF
ncbi:MAG: serine/threonine protein kinase [Deltaproteobacteria bacterium]|nr:serine/threonine protein kinase [Deltaproteobacteria bacterium]